MTSDVVDFPVDALTGDLPAETILDRAKQENLATCIVIGFSEDADLFIGSTGGSVGDVLLDLKIAERILLERVMDTGED